MTVTRHFLVLAQVTLVVYLVSLSGLALAQDSSSKGTSLTALMQQMTGSWQVRARMWFGSNAKAIDLPPAVARRELIRDSYLQEVMEPGEKSGEPPFTRVAYLNYNWINKQYEYFSLDSRLPQMMSYVHPGSNKVHGGQIELIGTSFVAPAWGARENVPFTYRLAISSVESNRQVVKLFLTEQGREGGEFLAFEYVYSR